MDTMGNSRLTLIVAPVFACMSILAADLDSWTFIDVDKSRADGKTYGLAAGDCTGDGLPDVVSGAYFWRNPGGNLETGWVRKDLGGVDACAVVDVDGDDRGDVITIGPNGTYWCEAQDADGNSWNRTKVAGITKTAHTDLQGYQVAVLEDGANPSIVVNIGGINAITIPDNPEAGNWPTQKLSSEQCIGLGAGDIDGDGDIDICGGYTAVWWLENPGSIGGAWARHSIGTANFEDRAEIADVNGDGKGDVVIGEENYGATGAKVMVFEAPADPASGSWTMHLVVQCSCQHGYMSMHVADFDRDGKVDIVTGEGGSSCKVQVWLNKGNWQWEAHEVSSNSGIQSHIGVLPVDLNNDGNLDIVSNSYLQDTHLYAWRNNAPPVETQPYDRVPRAAVLPYRVTATRAGIWISPREAFPYVVEVFDVAGRLEGSCRATARQEAFLSLRPASATRVLRIRDAGGGRTFPVFTSMGE